MNNKNLKISPVLFLLISSVILVLFNLAMSPLYDPTYITHDASVFYVIGRGMKEGLVPYKDLFDHKGIYIYFFYFIAALIGEKNSIGLFILSIIIVFVFTLFIYKIIVLYADKLKAFFATLFIQILSISMYFSHGSILTEYIALTTITISMFLIIDDIKKQNDNDKYEAFSSIKMLVHGILFSINLFNKANYCLYFIAVGIFVLIEVYINKKNVALFVKNIIFGIVGIVIGMLPPIIYCIVNDCLYDMFFATFIVNFRYVSDLNIDLPEEITTKWAAFLYTLKSYVSPYVLMIVSVMILKFKNLKKEFLFLLLSFITLFLSSITAFTGYTHYMMPLIPTLIPLVIVFTYGFYDFIKSFENTKVINAKNLNVVFVIVALIFSFTISNIFGRDVLTTNFSYSAAESRKVKREISKYVTINSRAKIFCFGIGTFYYNYLDLLPNCKYFYIPGVSYDKFSEPFDAQYEYITSFKADVVLYNINKAYARIYGNVLEEFLNKNYVKLEGKLKDANIYIKKEVYNNSLSVQDVESNDELLEDE